MLRFRLARLLHRLTQEHVAQLAGINSGEYSRMEIGRVVPTAAELDAIARVPRIPLEHCLDQIDERLILARTEEGSRG
ncbi:MAG TPA: helix-turn-helix transcriptional regulator [Vicinamibacterales bacterium]|jgi:transcriptional regulator with XRE-family HTH domain